MSRQAGESQLSLGQSVSSSVLHSALSVQPVTPYLPVSGKGVVRQDRLMRRWLLRRAERGRERKRPSAPLRCIQPQSDGPKREPAGLHLDLVLLAQGEACAFEPLAGQPEVRNLPAVSPSAADG